MTSPATNDPSPLPVEGRALRSTVTDDGRVELRIDPLTIERIKDEQVVVRVEASPINPSDLGMLLAGADPASVTGDGGTTSLTLGPGAASAAEARRGRAMPVGNEGAGVVVAAGDDEAAQALVGRTVAVLAGGMYATHRVVAASDCLVVADGTDPRDAASCFVNPLTALGMTETMRLEGHTGLVHTAAASNLGRMLVRICVADGVPLVNIVRRAEHVALLQDLGATHVVDSSADSFADDLTTALAETGATIAFDAIGGGELASSILASMERAAMAGADGFERYGSTTHKQVYIYGGLDRGPTTLNRTFGMAWSVGGWLLLPFLARVGPERAAELRQRVADELTTTFASTYTDTLTLDQVLDPDQLRAYTRMATGEKVLVTPQG